jgi:hypothetical protein
MKTGVFGRGRITWHGLILLPLSVWLFMMLSKKQNPRQKMNIISNIGISLFNDLQTVGKFTPEMARLLVAQSAHETGNFTSQLFKEQNNLFGMRHPRIRKTYSIGEKNGHAVFASVQDSIKDYKIYHTVFNYLPFYSSVSTFVEALNSRGYFTAPKEDYKKGVSYFYELYFSENGK